MVVMGKCKLCGTEGIHSMKVIHLRVAHGVELKDAEEDDLQKVVKLLFE